MSSALGARVRRVLLAAAAFAAVLPASAHATTLMVEHLGEPGTSENRAAHAAARTMGAQQARLLVHHGAWDAGAPAFDWTSRVDPFVRDAAAHGLAPFLTLTTAPQLPDVQRIPRLAQFGAWCREAATRYDGRDGRPLVADWGVWNEPNLASVGDLRAITYRRLYRHCRRAIKAVQPGARVYFSEVATSYGVCDWFDKTLPLDPRPSDPRIVTEGVAIHPYQYATHPTTPWPGDPCRGIGNLPGWRAALDAATAAGRISGPDGGAPPLAITEFGYCGPRPPLPAGDPQTPGAAQVACPQNPAGLVNVLDEQTRARWLADAFAWADANGVTVFDLHGVLQRTAGSYLGNQGGFLWESGVVANPSGAFTPSVEALRQAVAAG